MRRPQLVLCGAGHAHVHVAANAARLVSSGIEVTLVAPGPLWYSGMAAGVLGRRYSLAAGCLDPEPLVRERGGSFLRDRVVGIDREARRVHLASGMSQAYDAVSFNVGSEVDVRNLEPLPTAARPVKPIQDLLELRSALDQFPYRTDAPVQIVVVGGGPTGCEVAANLAHDVTVSPDTTTVTLLARGERLLPGIGATAARAATLALRNRGVTVRTGAEVVRLYPNIAVLASGEPVPFDFLVLATGLRPAGLMQSLGLPVGRDGGLLVNSHLQSAEDPRVFGSGDCVTMTSYFLPRIGVFGVRQGPVLLDNLEAYLTGGVLRSYVPQKRYLSIINLGAGEGLALWGPLHWRGRVCMRWKDWLDARWMRRYRSSKDLSDASEACKRSPRPTRHAAPR